MAKDRFAYLSGFVTNQLSLPFRVRTTFVIRLKIALGSLVNLLLKPLQIINEDSYFKLKKISNAYIYNNVVLDIGNKKFKARNDVDVTDLIADEKIDGPIKDGGGVFLDVGAHIGKYSKYYTAIATKRRSLLSQSQRTIRHWPKI